MSTKGKFTIYDEVSKRTMQLDGNDPENKKYGRKFTIKRTDINQEIKKILHKIEETRKDIFMKFIVIRKEIDSHDEIIYFDDKKAAVRYINQCITDKDNRYFIDDFIVIRGEKFTIVPIEIVTGVSLGDPE